MIKPSNCLIIIVHILVTVLMYIQAMLDVMNKESGIECGIRIRFRPGRLGETESLCWGKVRDLVNSWPL